MRKVLVGVFAVAGLALVCSTTEAKPKRRTASASTTSGSGSGSTAVAASAQPAPGVAPSTATPTADGDWSIADTKYWANLQEEMDGYIKRTNASCGTNITGTFDRESFRGHLTEGGSYGLSGYARAHCSAGPSAMEDICLTVNNDEATAKKVRAVVKAKLTNIECRWGGKGKQAIAYSNKKLTTTIDIDGDDNASSLTTKVTEFMKQKL